MRKLIPLLERSIGTFRPVRRIQFHPSLLQCSLLAALFLLSGVVIVPLCRV